MKIPTITVTSALLFAPDRRAEFSDGGVTGNVTTIDPLSYKRIIDILNYINLDGYKNGSPGQERQMLEVTYNEHNSAWIYGTYGSRALRLLYAELEKLKVTQKWERSY